MSGKTRINNADIEATNEIYKVARAEADQELAKMDEKIIHSNKIGVMAGRAQAFRSVSLISEFLAWKQLARMFEEREHLNIPGVSNIEDYFEKMGIKPSTAYNNLKIARTLDSDELQLLGHVGFTRRDLLGYASLPEDKRLEIREGKVINLETASREEIKDLIEQVVMETRAVKEEAESAIAAKERVLKDKEAVINKQAKELTRYDREAKQKSLLPEEDAVLGKLEELDTVLYGYVMRVENVYDALMENPFAAGVAAFITLMDNIKMRVSHFREVAVTDLAPAGMLPEEEWVPPPMREKTD